MRPSGATTKTLGTRRTPSQAALASAPGLAATIPLRLVVSADGSAAVQATTEAGGAGLSDCVAAVLRRIAYPPADDGTACTLSVVLDHGQHGW